MALGDRYRLDDLQTYLSQGCLNIYFYKWISGSGGGAADLIAAWEDAMLDPITDIQVASLTHVAIQSINVDDVTDYGLDVPVTNNVGNNSGQGMPPFVCWAFRYNRATRAVRNGQKRIPGVPESGVEDGVASSGSLDALAGVATAMAGTLVSDALCHYEPRIMRRVFDPGTGITTYTDFPISGVIYTRVSSQNTRKFGRGS